MIGSTLTVSALAVSVGADAIWLVALGKSIARHGIPRGIPFAAAPSAHWANVPVLGELIFAGLHSAGTLGLPAAQLVIDVLLLGLIAGSARRLGARDGGTAIVLLVFAIGALPALGVVRGQLLSLIPFALLVILLRAEHTKPTHKVWWVPPLLAVWGNLHGAVLLGLAIAVCYLLFARLRTQPITTLMVFAAAIIAIGVNPAGPRTVRYYTGVLTNEAARRHTGLWSRLSLTDAFDVVLVLTAIILLALVVRRRPGWEYPVIVGLAAVTLAADRNGVWLLLFCAAPAAAALSRLRRASNPEPPDVVRVKAFLAGGFAALAAASAVILLGSRTAKLNTDASDARQIGRLAAGRVVLAPEPLAETLAAAGVRVWLSNPIDAFSKADQSAYLDFLAGHGAAAPRALSAAQIAVVEPSSASERLATQDGFTVIGRAGVFDVLARG